MPASCERPLVVRCGAFGDMVLVTSLIRDLSVRFGCKVDVLTSGPWSVPLLTGQAGVGDILCVRSRKTPYWLSLDQQRVVRRLRLRGVSPVWFCDGNDAARPMLVSTVRTMTLVDPGHPHQRQVRFTWVRATPGTVRTRVATPSAWCSLSKCPRTVTTPSSTVTFQRLESLAPEMAGVSPRATVSLYSSSPSSRPPQLLRRLAPEFAARHDG